MYGRAFAMILMTAVLCLGGMTNAPAAPTSNAAVTSAPVRESAVTVRETVAETIAHHRGLKVIQENLDVTRYELRRAKAHQLFPACAGVLPTPKSSARRA